MKAWSQSCHSFHLLELRKLSTVRQRQSNGNASYVYMSAQPLPIGTFGMGIDVTKITLLSWKPLYLAGKV